MKIERSDGVLMKRNTRQSTQRYESHQESTCLVNHSRISPQTPPKAAKSMSAICSHKESAIVNLPPAYAKYQVLDAPPSIQFASKEVELKKFQAVFGSTVA